MKAKILKKINKKLTNAIVRTSAFTRPIYRMRGWVLVRTEWGNKKAGNSLSLSLSMAKSSMASLLKAYWLPLILLASSVFYQLFILPRSYPPSHYDGESL